MSYKYRKECFHVSLLSIIIKIVIGLIVVEKNHNFSYTFDKVITLLYIDMMDQFRRELSPLFFFYLGGLSLHLSGKNISFGRSLLFHLGELKKLALGCNDSLPTLK